MKTEAGDESVYSKALDTQTFNDPAQASLFALTVDASRHNLFSWSEWGERFSTNLAAGPQNQTLEDYFNIWMDTLQSLLAEKSDIGDAQVAEMAEHWRRSYLATPHGDPIELCLTLPPQDHVHHHHHHHHHHHAQGTPAAEPVFVDRACQV
jgi:nitrile hydratase accessory protein